ncbi:RNA polymerase sigma factor [Olivibacter sitiensis]|uniref:RNA polymerase sigma factor n=1 Tax=Olivibacter sitiensis TaxID=376470 RepID=UPI0004014838|nr:RNA polymerase sigma-70 factor [Olivibacter sitiensis]
MYVVTGRSHSDKLLLTKLAAGDVRALEELMEKYEAKVYHFILRWVKNEQLAEEITQDIFVKIWEQKEKMQDVESMSAWLYTTSKNRALNSLQESLARQIREAHYAQEHEWHEDGDEVIMQKDLQRLVGVYVEHLPPRCKEVFLLKKEQGLTNDEIGASLNISTHTVKNQLKKSYAMLRKMLSEHAYAFIIMLFL